MRVLFYPEYQRLEMAEQSKPTLLDGEVLLRVAACGICGSELEAFKNRSPRRAPPLVMGHEFCGVVEEGGPGVRLLARGERVVSHSLFGCGQCVRCARGDSRLCGTTVWIGLHENTIAIDSYEVTLAERRVQGSYAASLDELQIAVDLLASGRVDGASWIKTFPLVEGVEAFHRMLAARGADIKAVLLPA